MDDRVGDYIRANLQQGYSAESIKSALVSQGYDPSQVEQEINQISGGGHKPHSMLLVIIVLVILAAGLAGAGAFLLLGESDTPNNKPVARPNPTPSQPVEVVSPEPFEPDNEPDPEPSESEPLVETEPEPQPTPAPNFQTGTITSSRFEIAQEVEDIAADYPEDAFELCNKLKTISSKDWCYAKVAIEGKNEQYCEGISTAQSRDACYLQFPTERIGDVLICDNIESSTFKSSCRKMYSLYNSIETSQTADTFRSTYP